MKEFVGRDEERQNLHQLLQQNDSAAIAAIAGMGGIGKTELAIQFKAVAPTIPHLKETALTLKNWLKKRDLVLPYLSLGRFYEGQGDHTQAEYWREQCLIIAQNRLGDNHQEVIGSWHNLGEVYQRQGRYEEAEKRFEQSLELARHQMLDNGT